MIQRGDIVLFDFLLNDEENIYKENFYSNIDFSECWKELTQKWQEELYIRFFSIFFKYLLNDGDEKKYTKFSHLIKTQKLDIEKLFDFKKYFDDKWYYLIIFLLKNDYISYINNYNDPVHVK